MNFNTEQTQSSSDIMSLYIPYVRNEYDEEFIRSVFYHFQIGEIERVDFFRSEQVVSQWPWARSAFVHLKCWYFNDYTDALYEALTDDVNGSQWKISFGPQGEFWVIKKMNVPKIPNTDLNIHQIASKMSEMETELQSMRREMELNAASRHLCERMIEHVLSETGLMDEPMDIDELNDDDMYADMPPLVPADDELSPNVTIRRHRSVSPASVSADMEMEMDVGF
jgi:hypothetical protein